MLGNWACPYPVGIVMDLDVRILVHGGEGHAMLQLIGQDPPVHHMVAERVEQFDVDVAYQGIQHFLERKGRQLRDSSPLLKGEAPAPSGPRPLFCQESLL